MIIRVGIGMYMVMVLMVLGIKFWVPERGIEKRADKTNCVVYVFVGCNGTVHSIVRGNKQAGVQVHLH